MHNFGSRIFQLWEYHVSHGSLLIRSPRSERVKLNVDILCSGVEYIEAPRFIRGLKIVEPLSEEVFHAEKILNKQIPQSSIHILVSAGKRFLIVAAQLKVEENENDIFDSPFE